METSVQPHWLAIDGMQPATAENAQPRRVGTSRPPSAGAGGAAAGPAPRAAGGAAQPAAAPAAAAGAQQGGGEPGGIVAGLPLRHSLPDELQLYYDMVRRALQSKGGAPLAGRAVAASLATDPGAWGLVPRRLRIAAGCALLCVAVRASGAS